MNITETNLPGVLLIEPRLFTDNRGLFLETYHAERYLARNIGSRFVQDNLSFSGRGVLRGLHYQLGKPQGKLVMALQGEVYDVAVDIRKGSPTFGRWVGAVLSSKDYRQIYIPEGFAHFTSAPISMRQPKSGGSGGTTLAWPSTGRSPIPSSPRKTASIPPWKPFHPMTFPSTKVEI
jgi:hypothetical protein